MALGLGCEGNFVVDLTSVIRWFLGICTAGRDFF